MIAEFVKPGYLVFDIGANDGMFAQACLAAGASHVISVEPQNLPMPSPYGAHRVTVIRAAVGSTGGSATLHISGNSKWSSLHAEWVTGHKHVTGVTETVPVITLDDLIADYGMPDFVKIDTEGHEAEVLRGLSHRLPSLSFEYHGGAYPVRLEHDPLPDCLMMLPGYEFRAAQHETEFVTDWVTADALLEQMPHLTWGDVYARAVGP